VLLGRFDAVPRRLRSHSRRAWIRSYLSSVVSTQQWRAWRLSLSRLKRSGSTGGGLGVAVRTGGPRVVPVARQGAGGIGCALVVRGRVHRLDADGARPRRPFARPIDHQGECMPRG
jgi:hypothetical protein